MLEGKDKGENEAKIQAKDQIILESCLQNLCTFPYKHLSNTLIHEAQNILSHIY